MYRYILQMYAHTYIHVHKLYGIPTFLRSPFRHPVTNKNESGDSQKNICIKQKWKRDSSKLRWKTTNEKRLTEPKIQTSTKGRITLNTYTYICISRHTRTHTCLPPHTSLVKKSQREVWCAGTGDKTSHFYTL